jgi:hypothetical protein
VLRHAVLRTDVTVLDQRLPLRLANRSPRRRELGRCRNSSEAGTRPTVPSASGRTGKAAAEEMGSGGIELKMGLLGRHRGVDVASCPRWAAATTHSEAMGRRRRRRRAA